MRNKCKGIATIFLTALCLASIFSCSSRPNSADPGISGNDGSFSPVQAETTEESADACDIMIPTMQSAGVYDAVLNILSEALDKKGFNIRFKLYSYTAANGIKSYVNDVKAGLSSGNAAADAFVVSVQDAGNLFDNGLTMDLTLAMPSVAPAYYGKVKSFFTDRINGAPIGVCSNSVRQQAAFMLRSSLDPKANLKFQTINDVLSYIENGFAANKKTTTVIADAKVLVNLWALDQSFYPLDSLGVSGYLYAGISDQESKPVLLEKIPGFYDFIDRIKGLYKNGYLSYPNFTTALGWEVAGVVRNIGDYYLPDYNGWYDWISGDFDAHILYPDLPSFYPGGSAFANEIVLPSGSGKSGWILRFVDWLYSNQGNYDTVIYGREGVDYSLAGGKVSRLKNGEQVAAQTRDQTAGLFDTWPGVQFFSCSDYNRLPANAPRNIDQVIDKGNGGMRLFPFNELWNRSNDETRRILQPTPDMTPVIAERTNLLGKMISSRADYTLRIAPLEGLDNDMLVNAYAGMMAKFVASVIGQK